MSGSGTATKIWASTGQPEARFEGRPQPAAQCPAPEPEPVPMVLIEDVTCTFTIDNEVRWARFNGQDLDVFGDLANWGAQKTINF